MRRTTRIATALLLALPLVSGLAACSTGSTADADAPDAAGGDAAGADGDGGVSVADAWVKATDEGMTGVFGTLVNDTDEDVVVTSGTSPAAARLELHTTAMGEDGSMVMTPVEDGFVVPANGTHTLEPGADHLMLMELAAPLEPGAEVELALRTADGESVDVVAVVRTFAGGQEEYEPADD